MYTNFNQLYTDWQTQEDKTEEHILECNEAKNKFHL